MNITNLHIAKTAMTWHGIELNEGDLYGHEAWHGAIYCHAPIASGNFVHFATHCGSHCSCRLHDLPSNISYYEGMDGNIYFEEEE